MLCQLSTDTCLVISQIEARPDHDPFGVKADIRIGPHAWDRSYAQSYNSFAGSNLNVSIEWSGGASNGGQLHGSATLVDHQGDVSPKPVARQSPRSGTTPWAGYGGPLSAAATTAAVLHDAVTPAGYVDVGNGFCVDGNDRRPQNWLCDDSGSGAANCSFVAVSCADLCGPDGGCTGFMLQDMSLYRKPPTCSLVTPNKPTTNHDWVLYNPGGGYAIAGHDGETRDTCFKKAGAPTPPGPPSPPAPASGYTDLGEGYCVDSSNTRPESYLCDSSGGDTQCSFTRITCQALCSADPTCTGYMMQDMSQYGKKPTCNLVTTNKPASPGQLWVDQHPGAGLAITGHDGETRDHCYKKTGTPGPPGPPSPPPPPAASDFVLVLQARFAWWRAGTVSASADGTLLTLAPFGRPAFTVTGFGAVVDRPSKLVGDSGLGYCSHVNSSQACVAFALEPGSPVAFTTSRNDTAASVLATIAGQKAALLKSYASYGDYSWAAESVGAAVGWNFKFHPSEVGPHLPVSPSWAGGYVAPYDDFNEGGSFGWDCTFASYLASLGSREMAYSGLITILKAKTSNGFMPNCASAGSKSEDRTEPNAGAKVR